MANEARVVVMLACTECKERTYATTKNKRKHPGPAGAEQVLPALPCA